MAEAKTQQLSKAFREETSAFREQSLAKAIQEIGTVDGLPADLSTDAKHMHGFGMPRKGDGHDR